MMEHLTTQVAEICRGNRPQSPSPHPTSVRLRHHFARQGFSPSRLSLHRRPQHQNVPAPATFITVSGFSWAVRVSLPLAFAKRRGLSLAWQVTPVHSQPRELCEDSTLAIALEKLSNLFTDFPELTQPGNFDRPAKVCLSNRPYPDHRITC